MKVWRAALRLTLAATALVAMVGTAAAQSSTSGDIQGIVRDPEGAPVAGATVVAAGPQGARATTTDAGGQYLIEFLNPGTYDVTATGEGFQPVTQQGVRVRLGTRATLNLSLAPLAETEETITITATAPTVDTTTTSTSTNIGSDLIGNIPTGRTFSGLVTLAPGVVDAGDLGNENPSISGASGLENQYIVNGVNITNAGYGSVGSYSIRYGSLGSGVNFDFIDAVNVKSAGFEAEYGQALGGIIAVSTKRGGNELHGSIFSNWSPGALQSPRRQRFLSFGAAEIGESSAADVGVTVGGPLVQDKAFFFAAVNPQSESQVFRAPAHPDNDFPLVALGDETRRRIRTSYAGTLTWNVMDNHTLDLSLFGDPGFSEYGPQSSGDVMSQTSLGYSRLDFGGNNQILRYSGVFGSFMSVEASVAHADNVFAQSFPGFADQYRVIDFRDGRTDSGGVGFYEKNQVSDNTQYQIKATNYVTAMGRHEIKYGLAYEDVAFNAETQYSGPVGGTYLDEDGNVQTFTTGVIYLIQKADDGSDVYRVVRGRTSSPVTRTKTDYTSIFLQDKWSPIPTLSLDLGVRFEQQRLAGGGEGATTYTFNFMDNFAPRLGAAWDFTGNGRGKVFAHYGRYVEKIPNDIAVRALSAETSVSLADYSQAPGPGGKFDHQYQIPDGTVPVNGSTVHVATLGAHPTEIAKGTKSQYQDEITFGAEYEAMPALNVGLRYIHRELGRVLEDYQTATADGIFLGTEEFQNYIIGNPGPGLNSLCPPEYPNCWVPPSRTYDALELTVEKRLATNWQMLASYRLARLYGNYEGLYRNDNGQSDPNITALFDFPNNTPMMEGQGRKGPLNTDRTHVLKIAGSYATAIGLNLGGNFQYFTGTPISRFDAHPIYQNAGEIPVGGRGVGGRTPVNYSIDVHADYGLPLRQGLDLRVAIDIFNILDNQETARVDERNQLNFGVDNPDYGKTIAYQPPRHVRLGLRLAF